MRRLLLTVALLSAALGSAPARATLGTLELESTLSEMARRSFDQPERTLVELGQLRAFGTPAQAAAFDFTEAQIRINAGDTPAAQALIDRLASQPEAADRATLLRALLADRNGQPDQAEAIAAQALVGFERRCKRGAEVQSVAEGCDFRSAWRALLLVSRAQENQGANALADASNRFAEALARAGGDVYMRALSLGDIAMMAQLNDQPDQARQWLAEAQQTGQGNALANARLKSYEAVMARRRGDLPGALQAQEAGVVLARQAGAVRLVAQMQSNLVDAHMHQDRAAKAIEIGQQALPVLLRFKDQMAERRLRHNLSVARIKLRQFDLARREIARVQELRSGQSDTVLRMRELRELSVAWAEADQPKEALIVFHEERKLTALANARNREASLEELKVKYDSTRKQRDLDLLNRDRALKDKQLGNRNLAQQVGIAVGVLLSLSLVLAGLMVRKVRAANKRLKSNQALLRAQSERDPLTDLANRRHFLAVMEQQQQLHPDALFNGALLMIDIDHFKHVNDEHGHGVGDVVICEVARRITQAVRAEDLVVRWGGEEFLVFAPDVGQEQLSQLAGRILSTVGGEPVATEDGPLRITVSIGFAHFPLPPSRLQVHWEQAVNWADMALYTAKAQGRNRGMGIATVDASDTDALLQIEADFDAACSSDRVSLRQVLGPA